MFGRYYFFGKWENMKEKIKKILLWIVLIWIVLGFISTIRNIVIFPEEKARYAAEGVELVGPNFNYLWLIIFGIIIYMICRKLFSKKELKKTVHEDETEKELEKLTGGSRLSRKLFILHWGLIISAFIFFIFGNWKVGIVILVMSITAVYISYRLAGGKYNPYIYKSPRLKPLWGEPLADLIREITGRDLPTFALMATPEATVISVIDGYFCYKLNIPYLANKDIFYRILKARAYDSETEKEILEANPKNLLKFIKLILKTERQEKEMSSESINKLISKYCEIRRI